MTITWNVSEGVDDQLDKHVKPSSASVEVFDLDFTTPISTSTNSKE